MLQSGSLFLCLRAQAHRNFNILPGLFQLFIRFGTTIRCRLHIHQAARHFSFGTQLIHFLAGLLLGFLCPCKSLFQLLHTVLQRLQFLCAGVSFSTLHLDCLAQFLKLLILDSQLLLALVALSTDNSKLGTNASEFSTNASKLSADASKISVQCLLRLLLGIKPDRHFLVGNQVGFYQLLLRLTGTLLSL